MLAMMSRLSSANDEDFEDNGPQFLRGTGMTLLISMTGTIAGLVIGLLIGVFRTAPKAKNKFLAGCQTAFGWFLNVYIEIFRGTPMIVQSMVISTVRPKPQYFLGSYLGRHLYCFDQYRGLYE